MQKSCDRRQYSENIDYVTLSGTGRAVLHYGAGLLTQAILRRQHDYIRVHGKSLDVLTYNI